MAKPNNDKKFNKPNKDLSKRNSNSSRKISCKKEMKDKKFKILGGSIIKDEKDWELTDDSNKVVVKSFRGATTSQMKLHVKPTMEQNPNKIISRCGTNDINDDSNLQNIAKEIVELAKSNSKDYNSNITVSGIVPR